MTGPVLRVDHVVMEELESAVVPSQVMAPVRAFAHHLPTVRFRVLFVEPFRRAWSRAARSRLGALRDICPGVDVEMVAFVGRLGQRSRVRRLRRALEAGAGAVETRVVHCRGPEATVLTAAATDGMAVKVIFDARGASGPEAARRRRLGNGDADAAALAKEWRLGEGRDRAALRACDAFNAVSPALETYLRGLEAAPGTPSVSIPCCVDAVPPEDPGARVALRGHLGIAPDTLLLVHTSSSERWEDFAAAGRLLRALRARRSTHLLFVTTLPEERVRRLSGLSREEATVRRLSPAEVHGAVAAGDLGLLLREQDPAFPVAFPIKVAEYLAAGVAVIASRSAGDVADLLESWGAGLAVPSPPALPGDDVLQSILALADDDGGRDRCRRAAEEHLTWAAHAGSLAGLYGLEREVVR